MKLEPIWYIYIRSLEFSFIISFALRSRSLSIPRSPSSSIYNSFDFGERFTLLAINRWGNQLKANKPFYYYINNITADGDQSLLLLLLLLSSSTSFNSLISFFSLRFLFVTWHLLLPFSLSVLILRIRFISIAFVVSIVVIAKWSLKLSSYNFCKCLHTQFILCMAISWLACKLWEKKTNLTAKQQRQPQPRLRRRRR